MSYSNGVRVRNIIGLLGFLAQQKPGEVRQIGELRESFEESCLHKGDRAKKAGWETAVAVIKGVDEYELDNWAPHVRGQMHEALGTVNPPAGNEKSSPSALNMPYAVRQ